MFGRGKNVKVLLCKHKDFPAFVYAPLRSVLNKRHWRLAPLVSLHYIVLKTRYQAKIATITAHKTLHYLTFFVTKQREYNIISGRFG
jgi:hypothetical protein